MKWHHRLHPASRSLLCGIILIVASPATSLATTPGSPPDQIAYSGFLVDAQGAPLGRSPDNQPLPTRYEAVFRIYDQKTAGTLLWAESQSILVENGNFSILLGEGGEIIGEPNPPLSQAISGEGERFLQISVRFLDSGALIDIVPRQALVSAPYALLSHTTRALVDDDGAALIESDGDDLRVKVPFTVQQPVQGVNLAGDGSGLTDLDAAQISSGTLALARIPSLPVSAVTSGTFPPQVIPLLPSSSISSIDASKITSGNIHPDRLPPMPSYNTDNTFDSTFNFNQGLRLRDWGDRRFPSVINHGHFPLVSMPDSRSSTDGYDWYNPLGNSSFDSNQPNTRFLGLVAATTPGSSSFDFRVQGAGVLYFDLSWLEANSFGVLTVSNHGGSNASFTRGPTAPRSWRNRSVSVSSGSRDVRFTFSGSDGNQWVMVRNIRYVPNNSGLLGSVANDNTSQSLGDSSANLVLNRAEIGLRRSDDGNHGLAHSLTQNLSARWAGPGMNGALLWGWNGGMLGTTNSSNESNWDWTLRWREGNSNSNGAIEVRNQLRVRPGMAQGGTDSGRFLHHFRGKQNPAQTIADNVSISDLAIRTSSQIAASSLNVYSDFRIKTDIIRSDRSQSLDLLSNLSFVNYRWTGEHASAPGQLGVIAQELEPLAPEMIQKVPGFIPGTEGEVDDLMSVNYRALHQHGINALQALQAENEEEQEKIHAIRTRLISLRASRRELENQRDALKAAVSQLQGNAP